MSATDDPTRYDVTREALIRALVTHPLTEQLIPQARERMADRLLGQMPAVPADAAARLAELENAITWNTSCTSCARVLDSSIAEHERAERAEEKLAAVRTLAGELGDRMVLEILDGKP